MNPADLVTVSKSGQFGDFPQVLRDYDANNNMIYVGIAKRAKLTSDTAWVIWNLTYDANNNLTAQKVSAALQIWDNRSSGSYG